jgi:hypothetical protein
MRSIARHLIAVLELAGACAPLAAQQLTDGQRSAIKSACRGDYQRVCASVPPGTKDSLQCLVQHRGEVSSGCREALAPAGASSSVAAAPGSAMSAAGGAAAATAASAGSAPAAAAAPAAGVATDHVLSPREEAMALRYKCSGDFHKLCSGVQLGGGRAAACLREHASELTPACRSALMTASPR